MSVQQTVTVIGTGYVGLTTASLLAAAGIKVYAVDIDQKRLKTIKQGRSFFYEEGIDALISDSIKSKLLIPTSSYSEAIPKSSFVFSCVGTPDNPDGSSNLDFIYTAAKQASGHMKQNTIFVQKSTVPVGTGKKLEELFQATKSKVQYVSNPEFLREGTAISDSLWFDRVVVGSSNHLAAKKVTELYMTIEKHRNKIAALAGLNPSVEKAGMYYTTNLSSAELIKVTSNAFLALKISFANSIAKLADHTGADINEVMDVVGADHRIGRPFLNAGRGYGGGCFPKDVSGLISSANDHGLDLQIMIASSDLNESMPGYIANKAQAKLGSFKGKNVAVLGLAYKAGTSDARRSPGVKLANILARNGSKVKAYDPQSNGDAKEELRRSVTIANSIEEAIKSVDAVFITTDWPEFLDYDLKLMASKMSGKLFVDCMNSYVIDDVEQAGFSYIGVGRNGKD